VSGPGEEEAGQHGGAPEGLILLLFVAVTLAVSTWVLISSEHDAETDPVQKAARGEIQGLDPQSMLREANLRRALAKLGDGRYPLLISLRVSPTSVIATARDADGYRKVITLDPGLHARTSDFGVGEDDSFRASEIDTSGPERMARAVTERSRLKLDAIDYATLWTDGNGDHNWYMALDQGPARVRQWQAAPDGTDVRKPGELSQKQKDANAKAKRDLKRRMARSNRLYERRNACLQKARDARAAGRCIARYPL
jgi:hypothetical protein